MKMRNLMRWLLEGTTSHTIVLTRFPYLNSKFKREGQLGLMIHLFSCHPPPPPTHTPSPHPMTPKGLDWKTGKGKCVCVCARARAASAQIFLCLFIYLKMMEFLIIKISAIRFLQWLLFTMNQDQIFPPSNLFPKTPSTIYSDFSLISYFNILLFSVTKIYAKNVVFFLTNVFFLIKSNSNQRINYPMILYLTGKIHHYLLTLSREGTVEKNLSLYSSVDKLIYIQ